MAANQSKLAETMKTEVGPVFTALGIALDSFVVESVSLPEELQKILDQRISMNMLGDMGRYTQFQAAQSLPIAAANEGGMAGMGVGLGAGLAMGQQMANAMNAGRLTASPAPSGAPGRRPREHRSSASNCGHSIARGGKVLCGVWNGQG